MLENYPEFRHVSLTVGKHVTIMGELSRVIDERRLMKVSQVEQDLASQGDRSLAFSMVQELLEDPSVRDPEMAPHHQPAHHPAERAPLTLARSPRSPAPRFCYQILSGEGVRQDSPRHALCSPLRARGHAAGGSAAEPVPKQRGAGACGESAAGAAAAVLCCRMPVPCRCCCGDFTCVLFPSPERGLMRACFPLSDRPQRLVKTLLSIAGLAKRSGDVYGAQKAEKGHNGVPPRRRLCRKGEATSLTLFAACSPLALSSSLAGEKNLLSRAQKMVGGLKGVDNVYTQHQPLLQTTLDNILKG